MWSLRRGLLSLFSVHSAPHETKVCDDITQFSQWVIHRDSSWDVLFKLRLSPQIQLAAKLCHFLTILFLHFHPFSSFHMCFYLVAVCVFEKKCCKMQIPFWSITTASAFRLFVFEPANLFSHCCFHIQLWVSVQPQLPCHSFICLSNSED